MPQCQTNQPHHKLINNKCEQNYTKYTLEGNSILRAGLNTLSVTSEHGKHRKETTGMLTVVGDEELTLGQFENTFEETGTEKHD